ncbi:MAG: M48 family metalloprotease [Acidobacteria bacterium]|nr:M48 family metalloprotease [Acidobacteriota bacterium]
MRANDFSSRFLLAVVSIALVLAGFMNPVAAERRHGDVDKIGNRNISGRVWGIFPNLVSLEKEVQLGSQLAMQFEQTAKLVEDPVVTEYVDRVGQAIVKKSDAKVPFHIKVVDTDEVNAFALPGGFFYVNKGLILEAENEAELAGVMAHEISHVAARHATERLSKGQLLQFAAIPALIFAGPAYGTLGSVAFQNGLGLGIDLALLGITRESEGEADQLGIQYLWNTGYDPSAFTTFFEKLKAKEKKKPGAFASFFRTHPSVESRIEESQKEERLLPPKPEYVVTSSEFERVKARLVALDNKQIVPSSGKPASSSGRPQLKRKTQTGGAPDGTDPEEKPSLKRPTLKRDAPPDDADPTSSP